MNKSKLIALVLVVSLMLMGTAYAAWTQTINVSANVSTGELEVTVTKVNKQQMGKIAVGGSDYFSARGDFAKKYPEVNINDLAVGSVDEEEKLSQIKVKGLNFFPHTQYTLAYDLTNTGTIPADIDFKTINAEFDMPNTDVFYEFIVYDYDPELTGWDKYVISETGSDLEQLINSIETYTLEAEDKVTVTVRMHFTENADENSLKENHQYAFAFDVNISQFNIDNQ